MQDGAEKLSNKLKKLGFQREYLEGFDSIDVTDAVLSAGADAEGGTGSEAADGADKEERDELAELKELGIGTKPWSGSPLSNRTYGSPLSSRGSSKSPSKSPTKVTAGLMPVAPPTSGSAPAPAASAAPDLISVADADSGGVASAAVDVAPPPADAASTAAPVAPLTANDESTI